MSLHLNPATFFAATLKVIRSHLQIFNYNTVYFHPGYLLIFYGRMELRLHSFLTIVNLASFHEINSVSLLQSSFKIFLPSLITSINSIYCMVMLDVLEAFSHKCSNLAIIS